MVTAAAEPENNAALVEYLAQEKTHITIDINELKQHALPKNASQFKSKMQYISTILTLTRAKIESLEGFYDNQMKQQMLLNQKLNQVKQLPLANAEETYQERVGKIETFLTINKKSIELINENLTLARQYEFNLNDEVRELETWNANFQLEQKIIEFTRRKKDLSQELNALFKKNVTITNHNIVVGITSNHRKLS